MKKILLLIFPLLLLSETSFITPMEYASQLYKNPRGIGCQHCHGDVGQGKIIANYVHKGEKKSFIGPAINELDFEYFSKQLNKRKRGMPRYFLTKDEIEALFLYVNKVDAENAK